MSQYQYHYQFANKLQTLFLLFLSIYSFSQRKAEEYFPKPPEVAALGKLIDIPPGNYSGTAIFSIPLYEIDFDGYKIPISVSYHASGIKVAEIASRVGLGWTLNLGGVSMSGQIIGIKDFTYRNILPENFAPNEQWQHQNFAKDLLAVEGMLPASDIKPDIFSYSTLNSQGEFIWDSSGNFGIPRPYNLDKITPSQIIDEKGITYKFIDEGTIHALTNCSSPSLDLRKLYNFQPKEIQSPTGKKIMYNYDNSVIVDSKYFTALIENRFIEDFRQGATDTADFLNLPPPYKCYNYTDHFERLVNSIDFPNGKIELVYNNSSTEGREDLPGDRYLKRLTVKNSNGRIIKDYSFNYGYFTTSGTIPNVPISGIAEGTNKRLKLESIQDNLINKKYEFTYYNEELELPNRMSSSYDYWGVYNGKDNITSIATTLHRKTRYDSQTERLFVGADKNPDINYGIIGNLQEIKYPTGGSTVITYEQDDFKTEVFTPPIYKYDYKFSDPLATWGSMTSNSIDFTIQNKPYEFKLVFYSDDKPQDPPPHHETEIGDCTLKIYKYPDLINPIEDLSTYFTDDYERNYFNSLDIGTYKMTITSGNDIDIGTFHCYAETRWHEQTILDNSSERKAGTLRIKKVEQKDENQVKKIREYKYTTPESGYNSTSGKNIGDQYFTSIVSSQFPRNSIGGWTERMYLTNNPGWALSTYGGKAIGYSNVQEYYTSTGGEKYRKEYLYMNNSDNAFNNVSPYTFTQLTFPTKDFKRGYLLEEIQYDSQNNKVRMLNNDEPILNPYFNIFSSSSPSSNLLLLGLEMYLKSFSCLRDEFGNNYNCWYTFEYEPFNINNYWLQPKHSTITEYVNNQPKIVIEQTTAYSPNPPKHTFPISQMTETSLGEILTTEYYYPEDLTAYYEQSSMMNKLVERNMISSPVITKTFVDQTPVAEQRTHYFHFHENDPSGGFILPQYVYAKKGEIGATSSAEDKKITYDHYDEKGNLTEYTLADGTPVSIIWGYNGQYPIAKVEGVRNNQITNHILTLESLSNNGTLVPGSFESLRNFNGTLVTGYIYKPLVGVTTIIQPNGQREIYEYDTAGRLMHVKDHNGNVLKKVEYNYKN